MATLQLLEYKTNVLASREESTFTFNNERRVHVRSINHQEGGDTHVVFALFFFFWSKTAVILSVCPSFMIVYTSQTTSPPVKTTPSSPHRASSSLLFYRRERIIALLPTTTTIDDPRRQGLSFGFSSPCLGLDHFLSHLQSTVTVLLVHLTELNSSLKGCYLSVWIPRTLQTIGS